MELPDIQQHEDMSSDLLGAVVPMRMWGGQPATLLYGHLFEPLDVKVHTGEQSFVGFPMLLLAGVGMLRWRRNPAVVNGAAVLALIFFVLMLGPTLHIRWHDTKVYLPYVLLMQVPPFNIQRAPVRMVVFLIFFLTIVAAHGASRLRAKIAGTPAAPVAPSAGRTVAPAALPSQPKRWRALAAGFALTAILAWACAESYNPHTAYAAYQPPAALAELKTGGAFSTTPVASLPIYKADGCSEMLQIFNHRPNLSGYLARLTPKQEATFHSLEEAFHNGPEAFSQYVKANGADAVLVSQEGPPEDFYTPACSFLADLAGRVQLVDLRPSGRSSSASWAIATCKTGNDPLAREYCHRARQGFASVVCGAGQCRPARTAGISRGRL